MSTRKRKTTRLDRFPVAQTRDAPAAAAPCVCRPRRLELPPADFDAANLPPEDLLFASHPLRVRVPRVFTANAFPFDKKKNDPIGSLPCGALRGTRTPDLLVRSQTLYPAELAAHLFLPKYTTTNRKECQGVCANFFIFSEKETAKAGNAASHGPQHHGGHAHRRQRQRRQRRTAVGMCQVVFGVGRKNLHFPSVQKHLHLARRTCV